MFYLKENKSQEFLNNFFILNKKIYAANPYWVCPLKFERKEFFNPKKNPFFKHSEVKFYSCFGKDNILQGTLSVCLDNSYNNYHHENVVHFGFFECVENYEVAKTLFSVAENFAKEKQATGIRGPYNFSINHECGLLIDGFDSSPVILMTYNPKYYLKFLEDLDFVKAKDLLAYKIETCPVPSLLEEAAQRVINDTGAKIRKMKKKEIALLIPLMLEIFNDAWSNNWGFSPMDEEEFKFLSYGLKFFLDEDLSFVVDLHGKAIGFSITLPDYNQPIQKMQGEILPFGWLKFLQAVKKINLARVFVLGVKKEYHQNAFAALLYLETWKAVLKKGYKFAEMSWILEDNVKMRRAIEMAGAFVYKTYRIYEKKLR